MQEGGPQGVGGQTRGAGGRTRGAGGRARGLRLKWAQREGRGEVALGLRAGPLLEPSSEDEEEAEQGRDRRGRRPEPQSSGDSGRPRGGRVTRQGPGAVSTIAVGTGPVRGPSGDAEGGRVTRRASAALTGQGRQEAGVGGQDLPETPVPGPETPSCAVAVRVVCGRGTSGASAGTDGPVRK